MFDDLTTPKQATKGAGMFTDIKLPKPVQPQKLDYGAPNSDALGGASQMALNTLGGIVRGAGNIGATVLSPIDAAARLFGMQNDFIGRTDRREQMDAGVKSLGSDPESFSFGAAKLGTEIAGTSGVGGVLAKGVSAVAPKLFSSSPVAAKVLEAINTAGFKTGAPAAANMSGKAADLGIRALGGGVTGGVSAGLVNPDDAATGAIIGGALPPGLKIAGEAGKLIKNGTSSVGKNILGASTGTGADSISAAYLAGKNKSSTFLDNMRGKVSFNDVVDDAKQGLQKMRADRSAAYRGGMVDISNDKTVIDFMPIANEISKIMDMGSYKGQQINKNAASTVKEIAEKVNEWSSLDPAEFHTPEGLDALKQAIGDIRDSTQFGTAARRSADSVYNAIKNEITTQAPTYSKVMKDYSQASSTLSELERALSLGDKASKDTSIRKLQSLLRNNAQTSYGNRLDLAKTLEEKGGVNLLSSLAGQTMNSAMPRGITGAIQKGGALLGAAGTGGASIPMTIAMAPFTSPRLVGEAMYGIGRLSGGAGNVASGAQQELSRFAAQNPALLEARNALYRASPLMAILAGREAQQ